ncbi:hypothetical protein DL93DRAFT_920595 [Clavulina sp. PMI_390]|nr:hypothetical protein DL93DRAFT_920595 [Clavulina sp. PMI_390]
MLVKLEVGQGLISHINCPNLRELRISNASLDSRILAGLLGGLPSLEDMLLESSYTTLEDVEAPNEIELNRLRRLRLRGLDQGSLVIAFLMILAPNLEALHLQHIVVPDDLDGYFASSTPADLSVDDGVFKDVGIDLSATTSCMLHCGFRRFVRTPLLGRLSHSLTVFSDSS